MFLLLLHTITMSSSMLVYFSSFFKCLLIVSLSVFFSSLLFFFCSFICFFIPTVPLFASSFLINDFSRIYLSNVTSVHMFKNKR